MEEVIKNNLDWMVTENYMNGYNWIRIWNKKKSSSKWNEFVGFPHDLNSLKKYENKFQFNVEISKNMNFDYNYPPKKLIENK